MTGAESDWMAPWFAAMAITVAWLSWFAITYPTMKDSRHMLFTKFHAHILSPDRKDRQTIELSGPGDETGISGPEAGRLADAWVAENTRGWTVESVVFPGIGHDGSYGPRRLASYVGAELTA